MTDRVFRILNRANAPDWIYYWLLDRLTDNNGWRPLSHREAKRMSRDRMSAWWWILRHPSKAAAIRRFHRSAGDCDG